MNETKEPEVSQDATAIELSIIDTMGLEKQTAVAIRNSFEPFIRQVYEWKTKAMELVVTDVTQTDLMQAARESRLALKSIRVQADKVRKALKEDSNRYGKAVQTVYNSIESIITPIEQHLEQQERFKEVQEALVKAKLYQERTAEAAEVMEYMPAGIRLEDLTHEDYNRLLNGARLQRKEAIEQAERERLEEEAKQAAWNTHIKRREVVLRYFDYASDALLQSADLSTLSDLEWDTAVKALEIAKEEDEEKQRKAHQRASALYALGFTAVTRNMGDGEALFYERKCGVINEDGSHDSWVTNEHILFANEEGWQFIYEQAKSIASHYYSKEKAEAEKQEKIRAMEKAEAERKAAEAEKMRKELEAERAKLEAEQAELRNKKAQEEAEAKRQAEAQRKAERAPDKAKLVQLAENLLIYSLPQTKSPEAQKIVDEVQELLRKVSLHIKKRMEDL